MSTVVLRKVAVLSDLSTRFARDMGDKKIRHYVVPYAMSALGKNPTNMVKDYIRKEENKENSEIEFVLEASASILPPAGAGAIQIEDVTNILDSDRKVKKALFKKEVKQHINEVIINSLKNRLFNYFAEKVNYVIEKINLINFKLRYQNKKTTELEWLANYDCRLLPRIPLKYGMRSFNLVRFLSVAFESTDYKEAQESLLNDLRLLEKHGLILGQMVKPSLMALADTTGSGVQNCVLFCFPLIDSQKLERILTSEFSNQRLPLTHLGVKNETHEGQINWLNGVSPENKYNIEVVYVQDISEDQRQEAVLKAFKDALPSVNKAAEVTRELIKNNREKIDKATQEIHAVVESREQSAQEERLKALKKNAAKLRRKVFPKKKAKKTKAKSKKRTTKKSTKKRSKRNGKK